MLCCIGLDHEALLSVNADQQKVGVVRDAPQEVGIVKNERPPFLLIFKKVSVVCSSVKPHFKGWKVFLVLVVSPRVLNYLVCKKMQCVRGVKKIPGRLLYQSHREHSSHLWL